MNLDGWKVVLDIAVLAAAGLTAWNSMQMRLEVARLKLWILRNFQQRSKVMLTEDD